MQTYELRVYKLRTKEALDLLTRVVAFVTAGEMAVPIGWFTLRPVSTPCSTTVSPPSSFASYSCRLCSRNPAPRSLDGFFIKRKKT
jgi:hypothetical protein